jgi:hypothetical protein
MAMQKKYIVRLTGQERQALRDVIGTLKGSASKVRRAQVLLKCDADGPDWTDRRTAEAFNCRSQTVESIRQRLVTQGFDAALDARKRQTPPRVKRLDGEQEARIIAVRLGTPPKGFANWTSRLLAERVVALGIVETVSHETLRGMLKNNGVSGRKIQYWVIPPRANGEFAAAMENVLDTYAQPYDARFPVLTMDEQPIQLLKETRVPIPATKGHPRRVDYEYERAGTASIFMFAEPLSGWREVRVRERRTKADWACEMASLLSTRYRGADRVILVCDNLNTHTMGAFYEVFAPGQARELVRRLDFRYTPKHGSWLNVAENELSSMTRQCLGDRRFGAIEELRDETAAWSQKSNEKQRGVDWQFRIDDARIKLKSLYPKT